MSVANSRSSFKRKYEDLRDDEQEVVSALMSSYSPRPLKKRHIEDPKARTASQASFLSISSLGASGEDLSLPPSHVPSTATTVISRKALGSQPATNTAYTPTQSSVAPQSASESATLNHAATGPTQISSSSKKTKLLSKKSTSRPKKTKHTENMGSTSTAATSAVDSVSQAFGVHQMFNTSMVDSSVPENKDRPASQAIRTLNSNKRTEAVQTKLEESGFITSQDELLQYAIPMDD